MSLLLDSNNQALTLTEFRIDGTIHNDYAEFTFHQSYSNNFTEIIHAKYVIPAISHIHIAKLSVFRAKSMLELKIEEPYKNAKSYENAKNAGENSYMLEKLQELDMILYEVGEIAANEKLQIEIIFVCKAEQISQEPYWKLKIPKSLFPFGHQEIPYTAEFNTFWDYSLRQYQKFSLTNGNFITLELDYGVAEFKNFSSDYDLEVAYYFETPQESYLTVQKDLRVNRYAFHLSYKPEKPLLDSSEEGLVGEFVVILDINASKGSEIQSIKDAILLFIHSLPENCYFNIINFDAFFQESVKYDQSSVDRACFYISNSNHYTMENDIFKSLKYVLENKKFPKYPWNIFIVTNRDSWDNKNKIINLIKKYREAKINTVEIDTDEFSKISKGVYQKINSPNQIKSRILNLLKQTLAPAFTDILISHHDLFDFVYPEEEFSISPEEKIEISGVFKKEILPKNIELQFKDSRTGHHQHINWSITEGQISISSSILVLESKEYLKKCKKTLSIKKSKEYQVEGNHSSFNIERYEKKKLIEEAKNSSSGGIRGDFIDVQQPDQNDLETQDQEMTNLERNTIKSPIKIKPRSRKIDKRTSGINSIPEIEAETFSIASNSVDINLQAKRGRNTNLKKVLPQKKIKVDEDETQLTKVANQEFAELTEIVPNREEAKEAGIGYEVEIIINLQSAEGCWESSESLSVVVNNLLDNGLDISQKDTKFTTVLIVALFEEKCTEFKDLWDLVVMKAKRWLAKRNQKLISLSDLN